MIPLYAPSRRLREHNDCHDPKTGKFCADPTGLPKGITLSVRTDKKFLDDYFHGYYMVEAVAVLSLKAEVPVHRGDDEEGHISLFVPATYEHPDYATVGNVAISRHLRGRGVGSVLYREAVKVAKQLGYKGIQAGGRNSISKAYWDRWLATGKAKKVDGHDVRERRVREYNPCHNPKGSGKGGGRFCSEGIPGRTEALIAEARRRIDATEAEWHAKLKNMPRDEDDISYNKLTETDKTTIDTALKLAFKDANVVVRMPLEVLDQVFKDGRAKNQFDTGTSRGFIDTDEIQNENYYRRVIEKKAMGIPNEFPGKDRPVYGYIEKETASGVSSYGAVELVMKPEVRRRTTAVVGDSFGSIVNEREPIQYTMAEPLDEPSWRMLHPRHRRHVADYLAHESTVPASHKTQFAKSAIDDLHQPYVEAQVHGGVKLDDVAEIRVERQWDMRDTMAMLKKHGWGLAPGVKMITDEHFGLDFLDASGEKIKLNYPIGFRRVS